MAQTTFDIDAALKEAKTVLLHGNSRSRPS